MSDEHTQRPSARRLERARREGDVPRSGALTRSAAMLGLVVVVVANFSAAAAHLEGFFRQSVEDALAVRPPIEAVGQAIDVLVAACWPPFVAVCVFAIVGTVVQSGPVLAPRRLRPDFERLWRPEILSSERVANWLMDIALAGSILLAFTVLAADSVYAILRIPPELDRGLEVCLDLVTGHVTAFGVVLVIVSMLDLAWRRRRYHRRLMMTRREARDEAREAEADPRLRAQMRAAQLD